MGESIEQLTFSKEDYALFAKRLRQETAILKRLLQGREFPYREKSQLGLEVEAWLVDQNSLPNPINKEFLKACNNSDIVEEISQFNFEINTTPLDIGAQTFSKLHQKPGRSKVCLTG